MEANVPRKKSRLAKNKKKAWRKVDITDVEEFLEDERLQERTGQVNYIDISTYLLFYNSHVYRFYDQNFLKPTAVIGSVFTNQSKFTKYFL